jgi:hypothetical protein
MDDNGVSEGGLVVVDDDDEFVHLFIVKELPKL